jgi:two-component system CheB/CheR fusion protein
MGAILSRATSMPVVQVVRKSELERDHVYVIAPGVNLVTDDGHVQPAADDGFQRRPSTAIDVFFRALAEAHRERAMCVVLSGTGSDGALGVQRVKEMGGLSIAQDPEDAEFAQMPRSAIDTGMVDLVLPAAAIGTRLVELQRRSIELPPEADEPGSTEKQSSEAPQQSPVTGGPLAEILSLLRFHTRHDFRRYKRSTVLRRIARRMQVNSAADLDPDRDFLAASPKLQYRAPAYGLLGAALENSNRYPEAAEAYTNASKAADLEYLKARYLIDAGRSYSAAGKTTEAAGAYREVVQKYPKSTSFTEAQVRLAELTDGKM